ncbi:MAG TPA: DUF5916 domain-containing protein, partial [Terriglobales bacterium]|nr:DUF5916 domain-containing protein [Terriglobales bacterium]
MRSLPIKLGLLVAWVALAAAAASAAPETSKFGTIAIPRIDIAPKLEDFVEMKPSPAFEGKLASVSGLIQRVPTDGAPSTQRTDVYLGYDSKNLYAIFVAFDTEPSKIRARLSRREDIFDDDSVEIMLDTFHDHRRAYSFLVNPMGVQADALWTEDVGFDFSFDTIWESQAKLTERGYLVWMAIPFRSLRFASNDPQTWGIILNRGLPRSNEDTFWPPYSSRIQGRLNQEGAATGLSSISPGRNLQFIPYGIFRSFRELDLRDPNRPVFDQRHAYGRVGLDAKSVLKDKFVLDATINPDFSQVESDEPQVTVNQRFEVLFPEKRPFFLENSNYFNTPINLVFTRRIVDPKYGLRLTGKDGPWAVGLLMADDASAGETIPRSDPNASKHAYFGIGRVSYDLGRQSNVGAIFTDREFAGSYNRVGGIDGRLTLNTNWVTTFQGVVSSTLNTDGTYQAGPAAEVTAQRQGLHFTYNFDYSDRSNGFVTEPGFDPQPDIHNIVQHFQYTFRREGSTLISWAPIFDTYETFDHGGNHLNSGFSPALQVELKGQTYITLLYAKEMELLRPKDFAVLPANNRYVRHTTEVTVNTNYYRAVSLKMDVRWGTRINYDAPTGQIPFLAGRTSVNTTLTVRPSRKLRVDNTYILFRLHDRMGGVGSMNNHIIRSKLNYQFTRALSFRFIGQYNSLLTNPTFTSLQTAKDFNADFLVTYLLRPSTAIYVGYNTNRENLLNPLAA